MIIYSVPLEVFSLENGYHANVEIMIDGHKKKVLFDTGAPSSRVKNDDFISKYPTLEKKESKGVSGKVHYFEVFQPNKIMLGDQAVLNPKLTRGQESGVLGLNILENTIFQYDLKNATLNFLDKLPEKRYPIKRLANGHLTIQISFGGVKSHGLFDTGSDATIVDEKFIRENESLFKVKRVEMGTDHHGHKIESKVYECEKLIVGDVEFLNVEVASFEFPDFLRERMEGTVAILGNNIIGNGKWSFDIKNKSWAFEK
jgi:hypothetical protein